MKTEPSSIDSNTSSSSQDTYEGNMTFTRVSKSDVSDVNTETSEGSVGVTAPDLEQLEENDLAQLIENNDRFVLEHLIFDLGKANLLPEAKMELDKLADVMKAQPAMKIRLEGHTDRRGGAKKNKILSEKRVESAKKYLVKTGIAKSRVETKGWGDAKPIVISANVEEGKVNRRVEIQVLER
ncbi:MAG: outer membrane protein OmpA-like peptidoglycan-associated protein [Marinoscillum sp.]|jgi:outer membrane protein OmpA-like peptidoglycan-associated protein